MSSASAHSAFVFTGHDAGPFPIATLPDRNEVLAQGTTVRPTIGVQCGPTAAANKPFVDNSKMPPWVGPSGAPMWVYLRGRFTEIASGSITNDDRCWSPVPRV